MKWFVYLAERQPARVAAWVSATVAIVLSVVNPDLPTEAVTIFVLSSLGLGEYAQRAEDKKTLVALYSEAPEEEDAA